MTELCLLCEPNFGSDMALIFLKIQEAIEKSHTDCVDVLFQIQESWSSWPGSLDEALVEAVRKGQFGLVKYLFKLETSWFLGDLQQSLCEAMSNGHIDIMEFLIASAVNAEGQTPLILATLREDMNMVKSAIQAGADVNRINQQTGQTALMEATLNGCTKIAILLIEAGAEVNTFDKSGHTALMLALRKGNLKMGEVLIKAGADLDQLSTEGLTALLYCALEGNEEGVKMLVEAGANVNRRCLKGTTALLHCVSEGNEKGVKMLLEAGADVNIVGESPDTALMITARKGYLNIRHENITKILIEAGADVNKICANNTTALIQSALKGNDPGIRLLLRSGAQVNRGWKPPIGQLELPIRVLLEAAGQKAMFGRLEFQKVNLHHLCRMAIKDHLLTLDPHENLFLRIPRLGLPSRLARYLLFEISLDTSGSLLPPRIPEYVI